VDEMTQDKLGIEEAVWTKVVERMYEDQDILKLKLLVKDHANLTHHKLLQ
jgi:hypothetical protein